MGNQIRANVERRVGWGFWAIKYNFGWKEGGRCKGVGRTVGFARYCESELFFHCTQRRAPTGVTCGEITNYHVPFPEVRYKKYAVLHIVNTAYNCEGFEQCYSESLHEVSVLALPTVLKGVMRTN